METFPRVNGNNNQSPFLYNASGGMRVSQMTTMLDGKILGEDDTDLWEIVGTGSSLFTDNTSVMTVAAGEYLIRQSKRFTPYFAGKPQLIECTTINFENEPGITKRLGYFSSNAVAPYDTTFDGIILESAVDGEKYLKTYNNGTLTLSINFKNFDNYSEIANYDFTKFTVFAFDFLWLGGAVLNLWMVTEHGFCLLHSHTYVGTLADTFSLSPNHPIRYEIVSTTGAGTLIYVCCQVSTEGSTTESGKTLSIYSPGTLATNTVGTIYPLLAIRKRAEFRDTAVQILEISGVAEVTSDSGILLLIKNPTVTGTITWANKGKIQEGIATAGATCTGGLTVCSVCKAQESSETDTMKENFLAYLSHTIDNTMDEYVLAFLTLTNNQKNAGTITYKLY